MTSSCNRAAALAAGLFVCAALRAAAQDYGSYHTVAETEAELTALAKGSGGKLALASIGKSAGGRDLWVATVAAPGPVPADERPAVFVGANIRGYHNAGTEAALDLISTLLKGEGDSAKLLTDHTFYIAPILNPDAHDTLFGALRVRRQGNAGKLDRDRDGFEGEDGPDDLDGDGRITRLRFPDPAGEWLPHPQDPRVMVRANAEKGWIGSHRLESEGKDDDGDGSFNEDAATGTAPDRNFPHAFPYPAPDAGPWPGSTPEAKALFDFLLKRRNLALAVVYGPANNFLSPPESLGKAIDAGSTKFKLPGDAAEFLGFDPAGEYSLDEVWEAAKELPFIKRQGITKEQVAQFLGAGPANKLAEGDQSLLAELAKGYKERLKAAGLDSERPAEQYGEGGFTPWLYYQLGTMAVELDVWGVPKAKKAEGKDEPLTLARLGGMSKDDFLKLSVDNVADFLKRIKAPPQFSAEMVIERVKSDQATPEQLAKMATQMGAKDDGGGAGGDDDKATARQREVLAWAQENAPGAFAPWKEVTLPDGTKAEVGGLDPFTEFAPPPAVLAPAVTAHTQTVLELAGKIARLEIASLTATPLGSGVYRVEALAINRGSFATHTEMAVKARAHLPVRLELGTGKGVELLTGNRAAVSESLAGKTGTIKAEWLIRAQSGASVVVTVTSEQAGSDQRTLALDAAKTKGAAR